MEKMSDRRRKTKKAGEKRPKQLESLSKTLFMAMSDPSVFSLKSKLGHTRKDKKSAINEGLKDVF